MGPAWRTSRLVETCSGRAYTGNGALLCNVCLLQQEAGFAGKSRRVATERVLLPLRRLDGSKEAFLAGPQHKRAWWQKLVSRLPWLITLGWPPIKQGQACWGLSQCLQRVFGRKNCPAVHRGALNRPNSITLSRGGYSPRDACTACPGRRLVTISLEETHRSNNSAKTWPY